MMRKKKSLGKSSFSGFPELMRHLMVLSLMSVPLIRLPWSFPSLAFLAHLSKLGQVVCHGRGRESWPWLYVNYPGLITHIFVSGLEAVFFKRGKGIAQEFSSFNLFGAKLIFGRKMFFRKFYSYFSFYTREKNFK